MITRALSVFASSCLLVAAPAGAAVVSITRTGANLDSVTVSRGSAGTITYGQANLIGIDVTGFAGGSAATILVPDGGSAPTAGSRATLLDADRALNTGVINFSTSGSGLVVNFAAPVVNDVGIDLVFFEAAGSNDPDSVTVVNGANTITYAGTSYTQVTANDVFNLDTIKTRNAGNTADQTAATLAELESLPTAFNSDANNFEIYGLGIDLSAVGVAPGASVSQLTFRASGNLVDPVFIAGLPQVPEPSDAGLLLASAAGLGLRRRMRRPGVR